MYIYICTLIHISSPTYNCWWFKNPLVWWMGSLSHGGFYTSQVLSKISVDFQPSADVISSRFAFTFNLSNVRLSAHMYAYIFIYIHLCRLIHIHICIHRITSLFLCYYITSVYLAQISPYTRTTIDASEIKSNQLSLIITYLSKHHMSNRRCWHFFPTEINQMWWNKKFWGGLKPPDSHFEELNKTGRENPAKLRVCYQVCRWSIHAY